ncbi:hypothetical protein ACOTTU_02800 [Roseobacter sp. EG26]|uniref:hypothetical protein n=1 Tax=Roseobacter sp. EG26 TaxID=3412477 RepID=UPI003CE4FADF
MSKGKRLPLLRTSTRGTTPLGTDRADHDIDLAQITLHVGSFISASACGEATETVKLVCDLVSFSNLSSATWERSRYSLRNSASFGSF